jgi:transcriptional regulator with XRE-family HTH domain
MYFNIKISVIVGYFGEKMQTTLSKEEIKQVHMQIGRNVKKYRKKKGYSQLALSMELGYKSTSQISMAEVCYNGAHFSVENLVNISKCLGVSVVYLLGGVDRIAKIENILQNSVNDYDNLFSEINEIKKRADRLAGLVIDDKSKL